MRPLGDTLSKDLDICKRNVSHIKTKNAVKRINVYQTKRTKVNIRMNQKA